MRKSNVLGAMAGLLGLLPIQHAQADSGTADDAMPGVIRTDHAKPLRQGLALTIGSGYGFAGSILDSTFDGDLGDSHHRAAGRLALAFGVNDSLGFALRFDGRYDKHFSNVGNDHGWVGDPRLITRYRLSLSDSLSAGAQFGIWMPGSDAPSVVFSALSAEGVAAITWQATGSALSLSANLGYRLDRSAESVTNAEQLSLADRMSLGLSDNNAALFAIGASYQLGQAELLGEWSLDLLHGSGAVPFSQSPMRASVGARVGLTEDLDLMGNADLRLNKVEGMNLATKLVPIEPSFQIMASMHMRFSLGAVPKFEEKLPIAPLPKEPPPAITATLSGRVESGGVPVPKVSLAVTDGSGDIHTLTTDEEGRFSGDSIEVGSLSIRTSVEGFDPTEQVVDLAVSGNEQLVIKLEQALPPGQLRGLVKSFDGTALTAELSIAPTGQVLTTSATGEFEIDLPPGDYEVTISVDGYQPQVRKIQIADEGVTILNVDLRQ